MLVSSLSKPNSMNSSSQKMSKHSLVVLFCWLMCIFHGAVAQNTAHLTIDVSTPLHPIPDTLFGAFFEEINHAGSGGLWAELVSNRGFEAGGPATPSRIDPWYIIGDQTHIIVSTDRSSCFERNKVALKMEVLCENEGCPSGGVGVSNPGYWGMNIQQGQRYKVVFYVQSLGPIDITLSFIDTNSHQNLASTNIVLSSSNVANWTKVEHEFEATGTSEHANLQLTTTKKGTIWFDQVSAMPLNTYNGHGFRSDLFEMVAGIKPRFLRFPGGCFVEGNFLRDAFRWKETIGPWQERPGHFNDVWNYWTDEGLGYYEYLLLAEDLNALPIWVFNNGISHNEGVATQNIWPFVQEALDGIEFAKGDPKSTWGSVRAAMGHPEPFDLRYVAIGNEDCSKPYYRGNYLKFYDAIKQAYPEIMTISNCDGSLHYIDHPADYYDFHIYTSGDDMFLKGHRFDHVSRSGPKIFVSEYAVTGWETGGTGTLLAAVAEAAFLIGLEKNSDIVEMASYAPLFVNANDRKWSPDAIVFDSAHLYGTPSYYMQQFFIESSGATLINATLSSSSPASLTASAITWKTPGENELHLKIKIANFDMKSVNLKINIDGLGRDSAKMTGTKTVLTGGLMDENSFQQPKKVAPIQSRMSNAGRDMDLALPANSITSIDLPMPSKLTRTGRSKLMRAEDHP